MTLPVIIDTDPGIDDAMALVMALRSPELEVLGITTVFGNHFLPQTTRNALVILEALGVEPPVVAGAARPLVRPYQEPPVFVHGEDGLGEAGFPEPSRSPVADLTAAEFLCRTVLERPGEVAVVALGPLTNLALALRLRPEVAEAVARVVVMGGAALVPGNATPAAEANMWGDPEAASLVFGAPWPVTMVGLDVTERVVVSPETLERLAESDDPGAALVGRAARFYLGFHRENDDLEGIFAHDPTAVAALCRPELFELGGYPLRVETEGFSVGSTVVDVTGRHWPEAPSVEVAVGVDSGAVLALIVECLEGR